MTASTPPDPQYEAYTALCDARVHGYGPVTIKPIGT
jgi:hypothetical protein